MELLDVVKRFPKEFARKEFEKGDILAREGSLCHGVYIVLTGRVEVISFSLSGNKLVYNVIGPNEMFGNNLAYSSSPYFRGDVMASEKSAVAFIKKEDLTALLQKDAEALELYLQKQSDFGKSLNAKIKILSFDSAEERLSYYLRLNEGRIAFKTLSALAEELGLSREALSRLASRLEREGTIEKSRHQIILKKME